MKTSIWLVFLLLVGGCAKQGPLLKKTPLSAEEHLRQAKRCESDAQEQESMILAENVADLEMVGRDLALVHVSTTGNEPVSLQRPCWSVLAQNNERHRRVALRLLADAEEHRKDAARLVDAETQACKGLGEHSVGASPFYYAQDILKVEELRESGTLHGARVLFRKVPGLSIGTMSKMIECHQARAAALGYASDFQAYDPLSLPAVATSVSQDDEGIWVRLRSDEHATALAILGRANDCSR